MKTVASLLVFSSLVFGFDVDVKHELLKCADIKVPQSRLMCFDVLVLNSKPKTNLEVQGKKLTRECSHCHGGRWEISTNGERLVTDMSEKEILDSLLAYKTRKRKSTVMNYQMDKFSNSEIEMMAKYIKYQISSGNY